jgi:hypothetical protein
MPMSFVAVPACWKTARVPSEVNDVGSWFTIVPTGWTSPVPSAAFQDSGKFAAV